jgi:hypothetical protein
VFKASVLLLALVLCIPALWSATVTGHMSMTTALIRYLIAMPAAAIMIGAFRLVTGGYGPSAAKAMPANRHPAPGAELGESAIV